MPPPTYMKIWKYKYNNKPKKREKIVESTLEFKSLFKLKFPNKDTFHELTRSK